ncbi:hypothetical protein [uncultured Bacteroides sp.]|uniref:hypothetical protein n=1 Tax=uncultured Bacteroides sp. TaxID=162156 RepID=UPI0032B1A0CA
MNSFVKVLIVIVCLYVSIAKLYVSIFYICNKRLDAPVQFVDFFVFCSCVYLPILIWKKGQKIRYNTIFSVFLLISIILQIYVGLFDFLSKDPSVNQQKVLWALDIPNLLSVVIMGYLMFLIKKRIQ